MFLSVVGKYNVKRKKKMSFKETFRGKILSVFYCGTNYPSNSACLKETYQFFIIHFFALFSFRFRGEEGCESPW
jgi:hypothetical protein